MAIFRGAERHDDGGLRPRKLRFEPRMACGDVPLQRRLVDAPLAARLEKEMLDGVRHVDAVGCDARFVEQRAQQSAGRPDERPALLILLVAGLLADEHQARVGRPFTGDALRRVLPQLAAAAAVDVALRRHVAHLRIVTTFASIRPSTVSLPKRRAIAWVAASTTSPSRDASRASISLRIGVP
jgi:hypothetical protein